MLLTAGPVRRRLFRTAGAVGLLGLLAACYPPGGGPGGSTTTTTSSTTTTTEPPETDTVVQDFTEAGCTTVVLPAGLVGTVAVEAVGQNGARPDVGGNGGRGALVTATLAGLDPGDSLAICVGVGGGPGGPGGPFSSDGTIRYAGGGGGGRAEVGLASDLSLPLVIAGGGGGGGGANNIGATGGTGAPSGATAAGTTGGGAGGNGIGGATGSGTGLPPGAPTGTPGGPRDGGNGQIAGAIAGGGGGGGSGYGGGGGGGAAGGGGGGGNLCISNGPVTTTACAIDPAGNPGTLVTGVPIGGSVRLTYEVTA